MKELISKEEKLVEGLVLKRKFDEIRKVPSHVISTWIRRYITDKFKVTWDIDTEVITIEVLDSLVAFRISELLDEIESNGFPSGHNWVGRGTNGNNKTDRDTRPATAAKAAA